MDERVCAHVRLLPALLPSSASEVDTHGGTWHSTDVLYAEPHVERLWCWVVDGAQRHRLMLHVIHPCRGAALYHPHRWPSAMYILRGEYDQDVGRGEWRPSITETRREAQGSCYAMAHRDDWHAVRVPAGGVALTVMMTGEPYVPAREMPDAPSGAQPMLSRERIGELIGLFRSAVNDL